MSLDWIAPFRFSPPGDAEVKVEGDLPTDLRGRLLRTTPGGLERGDWRAEHWFDGLCIMYRFDLGETPTFRSRWLESDFLRQVDGGRWPDATFGTPRNPTFWHWLTHPIPPQSDNCNVNTLKLGESYLAMTETYHTLEIDPDTLAVKRHFPWSGVLGSKVMQLAHPRFHRERGEVITLCSKLGPTSKIHVTAVSPGGERRGLNTWKTRHWPYLHDFGLTDSHAIIVAHPYTVDPRRMLWSKRSLLSLVEAGDGPTQLIVVPLDGGEPRIFETDIGFVFHFFNSHQRGDEIVADVIHHEGKDVLTNLGTEHLLHGHPRLGGEVVRLRLSLGDGRVRREPITDDGCEFPRIHYRRVHQRPYRYGYAVRSRCSGEGDERRYEGRLLKIDVEGGETLSFEEPDWLPGEGVFVPKADASDEDDGYVLSVASHRHEERAQLWILEAKDLSLRARLSVDVAIPLGFHGNFYRS
jgi:carotenoid cleavage dioxygenase-like enzyme